MKHALICSCIFFLATGCVRLAGNAEAGPGVAPAPAFSIGPCIAGLAADCPGFLTDVIQGARDACRGAGGSLHAGPGDGAWQVDINNDQEPEYLVDISMAVTCEGAPGIFSCGSLGCPKILYEQSGAAWRIAGYLFLGSVDQLAVLPSGDLRVDHDDGAVQDFYQRTGARYELTYLTVRGYRVEVLASPHGLRSLTTLADVYSTPGKNSAAMQRYDAGTEVAIIGQTDNGFYYVSPCNACARGFVLGSAVEIQR